MNIYHLLSHETTPLHEIQIGNVLYCMTADDIPKLSNAQNLYFYGFPHRVWLASALIDTKKIKQTLRMLPTNVINEFIMLFYRVANIHSIILNMLTIEKNPVKWILAPK